MGWISDFFSMNKDTKDEDKTSTYLNTSITGGFYSSGYYDPNAPTAGGTITYGNGSTNIYTNSTTTNWGMPTGGYTTIGGLSSSPNVYIYGNAPTIQTEKTKINIDELGQLIETLKERLLIIVPNFEKHEKYEALKKAYDHYKLLEKMLGEDDGNKPK